MEQQLYLEKGAMAGSVEGNVAVDQALASYYCNNYVT